MRARGGQRGGKDDQREGKSGKPMDCVEGTIQMMWMDFFFQDQAAIPADAREEGIANLAGSTSHENALHGLDHRDIRCRKRQ